MTEARQLPPDYPGRLRSWAAFARPKTWWIATTPVISALALAYSETHIFDPFTAFFTFTIAVLMQMISNMENDLGYTERKAETGNRKGLPRATARGWITLREARIGIGVAALLALLNTALLICLGGWILAAVGISSLVAAYCYMGGPRPIAYTPFGELLVLVFFGLTAVFGTYYLQTGSWSPSMVLLGFAQGAIAASVLAVNNYRDREHDRSVRRTTLPVLVSGEVFLHFFRTLVLLPHALVAAMVLLDPFEWPCLVVLGTLPLSLELPGRMARRQGLELNAVMFSCIGLEVKFSLLFSLGALLSGFLLR